LIYRATTDQTITGLRASFRERVDAEKYVAAVYLIVVIAFFLYVVIHASRISRLEALLKELTQRVATLGADRSSAGKSRG
jgi:hypothetical protein